MRTKITLLLIGVMLSGCGIFPLTGDKKTVKPRYHHSYYKKHVYFKHVRVGRVHVKLFEKQGVKKIKKN